MYPKKHQQPSINASRAARIVLLTSASIVAFFFFQAEDGIRDLTVTGVQTCALPISSRCTRRRGRASPWAGRRRDRSTGSNRSEEHTSELQSQSNLVCRPLLEKKTIAYYFVYQALSHRLLVFYITSLPMFY